MSDAEFSTGGAASDTNTQRREAVPADLYAPANLEQPVRVPPIIPDESMFDAQDTGPGFSDDAIVDKAEDVQDTGPTVAPGHWLGSPDPWEVSGVHLAVPVRHGRVWRPRRFRRLPSWASAILLIAVAALALFAVIAVARTASPYLPGHHSTVPAAQHTPTHTPKRTPTPKR